MRTNLFFGTTMRLRKVNTLAFGLAMIFALFLFGLQAATTTKPAHAATTFTVTNTFDPGDGNCNASGCTLREAINAANAAPGADTINFNIVGSGPHTISPNSPLPAITDTVTINGYSQPGARPNTREAGTNAVLAIVLSGAGAGSGAVGLDISAANSTVKGLVINGWGSHGVKIGGSGATGNKVRGNYIGTDASGTQDLGNSQSGVYIEAAPDNTIGGTKAAARNIISGNDQNGVGIFGVEAQGNLVQGNYAGTDKDGDDALDNGGSGVIISDAPDNAIGGTKAAARNIISGNGLNGVSIEGAGAMGNKVRGNYVGTDKDGDDTLGNFILGVLIQNAPNNTIGGPVTRRSNPRNIISGNGSGVSIEGGGATDNKVMGNYVGTDKNGTAALGNQFGAGVSIEDAPNNTIGGTTARARNIISGPHQNGVQIVGAGAQGNLFQGNYVGTDKNGTAALGNFFGLIIADAPNNTIGGTTTGAGNIIAGNGFDGVNIGGAGATGNRILRNSIYDNERFGIELFDDANNLQNFPVLSSATKSGKKKTTIEGTLNSTPNTTFTIQFFSSPAADPSGNGEGKKFLGELTDPGTDSSGDVSFTATMPRVPVGQVVTATATNQTTGDTSEFSNAVSVA